MSDTVGFIRNLPTTLVKAFRATLEEVVQASLLLHVVDASSPHAPQQTAHVLKVLHDIGAGETREILVLNKIDLLPEGAAQESADSHHLAQRILGEVRAPELSGAVGVSARAGSGIEALITEMDRTLALDPVTRVKLRVPAGEGAVLNIVHERARVISKTYEGDICELVAETPESVRKRLARYIVE